MAFKEWVINTANKGYCMKVNEISVTYREASNEKTCAYILTINGILTEELRKKGFNTLAISQDDITGEVALIVRKNNGIPLKLSGCSNNAKGNYTISNKELLNRLFTEFKLEKGNRYILTLGENKSVREDILFYLITKPTEQ